MVRLNPILVIAFVVGWFGAPMAARAQGLSGCHLYQAQSLTATNKKETLNGKPEDHGIFDGTPDVPVRIDCDDMQFFADHMESYREQGRVTARGNVLFVSGRNRISADRMEFDTKARTGTFYLAFGTAQLRDKPSPGMFGTQEPDLMFRGDEIHKLGPKTYRIVRGGFTTCVQPTPRWEMTSGSITLTLEEHALLTNSLFKVKGVPVMYLPVMYYPINKEDRATGFVMPLYGSSTVRGQSISNAFFWAINRSQDATFFHDWFSKTGMAYGSEYRYVAGPGSQGNARVYLINEHAATYQLADGTTHTTNAGKSYTVTGNLTQRLPAGLRAQANADYFSSIQTQQRYQMNITSLTSRRRSFGSNISGNWGAYNLSATLQRNDTFTNESTITTNGSLPRVLFSRSEQPLAGAHLYFGVTSDVGVLQRSTTVNDVKTQDQGLSRMDVTPTLRIPFTKWPFLTVNSSVAWHGTYWTESLDPDVLVQGQPLQVQKGIGRRYFDFQTRLVGPVFNRIFNTPGNGYAEKFKHVIEPSVSIQRTTAIDVNNRIVPLEGGDRTVGSVTSFRYALANRLYAKKDTSREILSMTVSQSYYTDANAAEVDQQNASASYTKAPANHFSPVALQAHVAPTTEFSADFRTDWDTRVHAVRTLSANGSFNRPWLQATAGWSLRRLIKDLPGFDNPLTATHYLTEATVLHSRGNRLGGTYSFNYDVRRGTFLNQRLSGYYNTQCCGIGMEYQTINLTGSVAGLAVPQDKRFNLSFTLAGIGTFSNLLGAFGAGPGR